MTGRSPDPGAEVVPHRVAVVDDRAFVRVALVSALTRAGLDVVGVDPTTDRIPYSTRSAVLLGEVGPGVNTSAGIDIRGCRSVDDLLSAINGAPTPPHTDEPHVRPDAAEVSSRSGLTPRERTILQAVGDGGSAAQIAADFGISARTVERHKQSVMTKLGVGNQAGAVAWAAGDRSRRG